MRITLPADRPQLEVAAKDGVMVMLRPLLKADRRFIEGGLEELSVESRYARFGQGVGRLSRRELDYLSDVDQRSHVAWGAAVDRRVAGVGRYIVTDDGCATWPSPS